MNTDAQPFLTSLIRISLICWLVLCQLRLMPPAYAQGMPKKPCNNIVYIRATDQAHYFEFADSPLKQVVKVTVTYASINGGSISDGMPYETLWYNGRQALGCRQYQDLNIRPLNKVYIYLDVSSDASSAAAANALTRILLDVSINRDQITGIEVPSGYFRSVIADLAHENFYPPGKLPAFTALAYIYLPLIDEIGDQQMLIYSGLL